MDDSVENKDDLSIEDLSTLDPKQLKELISDQNRLFDKVMQMNRFSV